MTIVCEISDTPKKACQSKTQTGVVFRGPETGPCRAQDGLATGRSDEGWHQATVAACRHRQNAYPALPACLPMPAQAGRRGECLPWHARASLPGTSAHASLPLLRPIGGLSKNTGGTLRSRVILIGFEQSSEIRHNNATIF